MSTATLSPTDQIVASIKGLGDRIAPMEKFIAGLGKVADGRKVSPLDLVKASQAANGGAALFDLNGNPVTLPPGWYDRRKKKGIGMGPMIAAMAKERFPELNIKDWSSERAQKTLNELGMKAALAESSGITGGYTVPPVFLAEWHELALETAIMEPRAQVYPMTSATLEMPLPDVTTAYTAGQSPFLYGIVGKWLAEAQTRPETEPQFRNLVLRAHEFGFYSVLSNTLLADSAMVIDSFLSQLFPKAATWFKDFAFLNGNGVGKPLGIYNCPAAIKLTRSGGANTKTFSLQDLSNFFGSIYWGMDQSKMCFICHQTFIPVLYRLNDVANRPIFIKLDQGAQEKIDRPAGQFSFGKLEGIDVLITEKAPVLGADFDLTLIDASQYIIGDREQVQIQVSDQVNFLNNQLVYRVQLRVDGQPWLNQAITLADGAATVSFVVGLH